MLTKFKTFYRIWQTWILNSNKSTLIKFSLSIWISNMYNSQTTSLNNFRASISNFSKWTKANSLLNNFSKFSNFQNKLCFSSNINKRFIKWPSNNTVNISNRTSKWPHHHNCKVKEGKISKFLNLSNSLWFTSSRYFWTKSSMFLSGLLEEKMSRYVLNSIIGKVKRWRRLLLEKSLKSEQV
jgi:hypothetical protein